jgi:putative hydrolase of the HAD superfamily
MPGTLQLSAITFDVTNTLVHCPRVAEIYVEVLERHGIATSTEELRRWIPVVWQEFTCRIETGRERFSAHPQGARGWWRDFLERLCDYLESPRRPTRFTAAELYHRFARADAWEIYPEVRPTLAALQERGIALAVVSNWDERLGPLLTRLDLTRYFDALVISARIGLEKPDPRIFLYALDLLGVPPEAAAHVGDNAREDVEGALAAGMKAFHLVRHGDRTALAEVAPDTEGLEDLAPLTDRVVGL